MLTAERDLALLPTVEAGLRRQADEAAARADELNDEAARLSSIADHYRRHATLLRCQADSDPLEHVLRGGGRTHGEHLVSRRTALRQLQATRGLREQDHTAALEAFTATTARELEKARARHERDR